MKTGAAGNSYKSTPNTNVRPLDMGFPGTLPVLNKEAVRLSLMASLILNCRQPEYMYFEFEDQSQKYQSSASNLHCFFPVAQKLFQEYHKNGVV